MNIDELKAQVWRGKTAAAPRAVLATGFAPLDRHLPGGGWPVGALIEIFVDGYGIGELTLLMPAMSALTRQDPERPPKWIAWIAAPFVPYAPALRQHGVRSERVLMIHPSPGAKHCLWAIEQVVRSGSSAGVLAWLPAADDVMLRRLQLAAEDQACWTLLFRPPSARQQRSPAALRIALTRGPGAARVEILKCRGGRPGIVDITEPYLALTSTEACAEASP